MAVDHDMLVEHLTRLQVRKSTRYTELVLDLLPGNPLCVLQCVIDRVVEIDRQDDGYAVLPGGEDRSRNAAAAASARRTPWAPHSRPLPSK